MNDPKKTKQEAAIPKNSKEIEVALKKQAEQKKRHEKAEKEIRTAYQNFLKALEKHSWVYEPVIQTHFQGIRPRPMNEEEIQEVKNIKIDQKLRKEKEERKSKKKLKKLSK